MFLQVDTKAVSGNEIILALHLRVQQLLLFLYPSSGRFFFGGGGDKVIKKSG